MSLANNQAADVGFELLELFCYAHWYSEMKNGLAKRRAIVGPASPYLNQTLATVPRTCGIHSPLPVVAAVTGQARGLLLAGAACSDTPSYASADCISDAGFSVELYGDLRTTLSWDSSELECAGMPRPFGDGARLRFAGPAIVDGVERRLAFIVALPALQRGATAHELAATVTLIEENNGDIPPDQYL